MRRAGAARSVTRRIIRACNGLTLRNGDPAALPEDYAAECQIRIGDRLDAAATAHCIRATLEGSIQETSPTPQPPNVVLVITDDQRHDTVGWMPETLQRLALRGTSFRNAFSTHPICGPARATILTGLDSPQHGVYTNGNGHALDHELALGPRLSAAGYTTGLFGKYLHAASSTGQPPQGWHAWHELDDAADVFYGFSLNQNGETRRYPDDVYSTDLLRRLLVKFIRRSVDTPFLAVFAPGAPHSPADPANRHLGAFAGIPPHRPANFREEDTSLKPSWVRFLQAVERDEEGSVATLDAFRERQLESLLSVDEAIADIDRTLERMGIADNTIFIFTSDQGIHWGEHWSRQKFSSYEESIRVPLLLRYPRQTPLGAERDALVATTDLVPTILEFAGQESSSPLDGSSLREVIASGQHDREFVPVESSGGWITSRSRSLRSDRWKWIETRALDGRLLWEELYELTVDPGELENLAFRPEYGLVRESLKLQLGELVPVRAAKPSSPDTQLLN